MNKCVWTVACVATALASGSAHAASEATGVWIDHTGRGGVEITECGANLCGKIVWLKEGTNKKGCGIQVIGNAKPVGGGRWDAGWIHDPERGGRYSVELKPIGADKLRVVGYMGSKLFSETMIWKRAPGDLKRCDEPETSVTAETPEKPAQPGPKADPKPKDDPRLKSETSGGSKQPAAGKNDASRRSSADTGCKKYFPQIGDLVSVPCPR
jgi:uncharacterized protein (DUF2147 family)